MKRRHGPIEEAVKAFENKPVWHEPLRELAARMRKEAEAGRAMMDDLKTEAILQPPHAQGWQ